jgi:hypothetical protein
MAGSMRDKLIKFPLRAKLTTSIANLVPSLDSKPAIKKRPYFKGNVRGIDRFQWLKV